MSTQAQQSMRLAYGKAPKTEVPAGRQQRPSRDSDTRCVRCECPVVMSAVPDCPSDCSCHVTASRWFAEGPEVTE